VSAACVPAAQAKVADPRGHTRDDQRQRRHHRVLRPLERGLQV